MPMCRSWRPRRLAQVRADLERLAIAEAEAQVALAEATTPQEVKRAENLEATLAARREKLESRAGEPGSSNRYWRVCFARVPAGQVRCQACLEALLDHPSSQVREMLVQETGLPARAMRHLLEDPDQLVSLIAAQALGVPRAQRGAPGLDTGHYPTQEELPDDWDSDEGDQDPW